jgi:hypothetical protein
MSGGASAAIPAGSGERKRGELSSDFSDEEWAAFLYNPKLSRAKAGSSRGEEAPARRWRSTLKKRCASGAWRPSAPALPAPAEAREGLIKGVAMFVSTRTIVRKSDSSRGMIVERRRRSKSPRRT